MLKDRLLEAEGELPWDTTAVQYTRHLNHMDRFNINEGIIITVGTGGKNQEFTIHKDTLRDVGILRQSTGQQLCRGQLALSVMVVVYPSVYYFLSRGPGAPPCIRGSIGHESSMHPVQFCKTSVFGEGQFQAKNHHHQARRSYHSAKVCLGESHNRPFPKASTVLGEHETLPLV
jgi:hypothetical protein